MLAGGARGDPGGRWCAGNKVGDHGCAQSPYSGHPVMVVNTNEWVTTDKEQGGYRDGSTHVMVACSALEKALGSQSRFLAGDGL